MKRTKKCYPQKKHRMPTSDILKIHSLHSRDFSRELGGWRFTSQKAFLCSDDQKVLSAKIPSGSMLHTDGVTIFGKEAAA